MRAIPIRNVRLHAGDDLLRIDLLIVRQHDAKLIPAVARKKRICVFAADFENLRNVHQHAVSIKMPVGVVDLLKSVHIHHDQRQRAGLGLLSLRDLTQEKLAQLSAVVQARERVG